MRKIVLIGLSAVLLLPGCAGVVAYDASRKNAQPLFERVMAEARPDLPSEAAAKCVVRAMTIGETAKYGVMDTRALNSERRADVLAIAARPKAQACLNALPAQAA